MRIGGVDLPIPFCQAGLAGYSDRAMRLVARRRGCPYAVTEALLDVILLNGGQGLKKSIDINDEDHPTAGQIIGADADTLAPAAKIMADAGYDVVDLNFACPVKKIKNKARGGWMLQDLPRAIPILHAVRDAVPPNVPTTVSLRRGFDDSAESVDRFFEIVETAWDLGYAAVRVHARTVEQKYQGRARWPFLTELKQRYPDRTILGSGDVFTAEDAVRMLTETGVDCVWIARGAIGNPWIFEQAATLLRMTGISPAERTESSGSAAGFSGRMTTRVLPKGTEPSGSAAGSSGRQRVSLSAEKNPRQSRWAPSLVLENLLTPPTIHAQRDALQEHFSLAMELHGEQLAGRRMRKMGIKYSRFHPQAESVKRDFIDVSSLRDWTAVLDRWYTHDGSGVWPSPDAADEVNDSNVSCGVAV